LTWSRASASSAKAPIDHHAGAFGAVMAILAIAMIAVT
jgi:3-oxoacyl-(acyl-carrier-protein) synthase